MTENTSTRLFCRNCKREIFRKSNRGRIPTQCHDCRVLDTRQRASEHEAKKKAGYTPPTSFTCIGCNGRFPRENLTGAIPLRCGSCWLDNERARIRERDNATLAALRLRFETEGRWVNCRLCNALIRCGAQKGAAPQYCESCRYKVNRQRQRVSTPWYSSGECGGCGDPVGLLPDGRRPRLCPSCNEATRDPVTGRWMARMSQQRRLDTLKFGPSATRGRGPWNDRFTYLDIYRRDRWICQICRKRVSRNVRSPHPMCATADHIVPRSEGGLDVRANVRLAHLSCNASRNNRGGNEQLVLVG